MAVIGNPAPRVEVHDRMSKHISSVKNRTVQLPYGFVPRPYQKDLFVAIDQGIKRALCIWPRRAGKDLSMLQLIIMQAMKRVGGYLYVFPYATDARKNFWEGMTHEGRPFLDYIPKEILAKPVNNSEMKITLINGSVIRMAGSDKYDSLRGGNPVMYVFSEWATSNPAAMRVVQPIVAANDGIIVLNGTVNGANHLWTDYQRYSKSDRWYTDFKTAETLVDENGDRYISDALLAREREDGMSEDDIQREYYNNPNANSDRFILMKQIGLMRGKPAEGGVAAVEPRIASYPYNPDLPVVTSWDIGHHDFNAIWFAQVHNGWVTLIDYHQDSGKLLKDYVKVLQEKPYVYGLAYFPHDIGVTEWGGGSRADRAEALGLDLARLKPNGDPGVPKTGLWEGIDMLRSMLGYTYIDAVGCEEGLNCLQDYQKGVDKTTKLPTNLPMKNHAIHGADALRTLAVGLSAEGAIAKSKGGDGGKRRGRADRYGRSRRRKKKNWKTA